MAVPRGEQTAADGLGRERDGRAAREAAAERRAAIAELMDAYGDALHGYCLRLVRDPDLAEDVVQQVFLEAHRDLGRFEQRSSLRTWLYGIATHRCQDAIRSRRRRERRITGDDDAVAACEDPAADAAERVGRAQLAAAVEGCLGQLSVEVRIAVLARFHLGLSYPEMAVMLDARPDTLQARVARALPALRRCLEAKGWGDAWGEGGGDV